MAFSINTFKSNGIALGGARPNLFEATLTGLPAGFSAPEFRFQCKIAQIPASTVPAFDVPYFGRQVKVSGNRTFDNLTVTLINDEDFKLRNTFESWLSDFNRHEDNILGDTYPALSSSTLEIFHYGKSGDPIGDGSWKFINCFPVTLGEIALDWGSNDSIEEYTVEFAYDYWTHGSIAI
jgi:hypothetical protein